MLYTSYHAMTGKLRAKGVTVVNISRHPPRWLAPGLQKHYLELAPQSWMLRATTEEYNKAFDEILDKLSPADVYEDLMDLGNGGDVAIVCFEKDRNDCHRKTVAEWLEKMLGIEVPEYDFGGKPSKPAPAPQGSLF